MASAAFASATHADVVAERVGFAHDVERQVGAERLDPGHAHRVVRHARNLREHLSSADSTGAALDELLQPAQVAPPHRAQHGLGRERAGGAAHPPREGELLRPREAGAPARPAPSVKRPRPGDDAAVLDAHRPAGVPFGDGHAVGGAERSDAGDAVEAGADAASRSCS